MEDIPEGGELCVGVDMEWPVDRCTSIQGRVAVISIAWDKEIILIQVRIYDDLGQPGAIKYISLS